LKKQTETSLPSERPKINLGDREKSPEESSANRNKISIKVIEKQHAIRNCLMNAEP
jgi:hypothetical protein